MALSSNIAPGRIPGQAPSRASFAAAAAVLRRSVPGLALVSLVINLLALTSPLFMLQVYDRVIPSRSMPTLVGFVGLAVMLYAFLALLDVLRARVFLRLGESLDEALSHRVHGIINAAPLRGQGGEGLQPLRDLDNLRNFIGGKGAPAWFDLPWLPFYLLLCFLLHPWIGVTAGAGAVVMTALTLLSARLTAAPARETQRLGAARHDALEATRRNAEAVRAMGMEGPLAARWQAVNAAYLSANRRAGDVSATLGGISQSFRLMLQSAILAVGAALVIRQEVSAGVMIAASIMMGRAMAPVDKAIASWKSLSAARQSWQRLSARLEQPEGPPPRLSLQPASQRLDVRGLSVVAPGSRAPILRNLSLSLSAGSALGVLGPSGSGKSTLARALVGLWSPAAGEIRLDGARLEQWDTQALGRNLGYLPQDVELFDGTVAENIARFDPGAESGAIVTAARQAGVHDLILGLPQGYDTRLGEGGSTLSGGQRQRIGLARALFGDPFLVVLDEPNANLDAEGEAAVTRAISAIRARGGIAVIVTHRPSALGAVDQALVLKEGRPQALGPKDDVLARVLRPRPQRASDGGEHMASVRYLLPAGGEAETQQDSEAEGHG